MRVLLLLYRLASVILTLLCVVLVFFIGSLFCETFFVLMSLLLFMPTFRQKVASNFNAKWRFRWRYFCQHYWAKVTLFWMGVKIAKRFTNSHEKDVLSKKLAPFCIANHLSYIDIIVLLSLYPSSFIAKHELKSWFVMGFLMRSMNASIFIDRTKKRDVMRTNELIQQHLNRGGRIILFPEGKISNGEKVGELKSAVLEVITHLNLLHTQYVEVAILSYQSQDKRFSSNMLIWDKGNFIVHFMRVLMVTNTLVKVDWWKQVVLATNRKVLKEILQKNMQKRYQMLKETSVS